VNRFIEIIKYTWKAKGRHGIHSPFVYDLMDICFKIPVSRKKIVGFSAKTKLHTSTLRCLIQLSKHLNQNVLLTENEIQTDIEELAKDLGLSWEIQDLSFFDLKEKEKDPSIMLLTMDKRDNSSSLKVDELLPLLDENSLILIDGIRANDLIYSQWKQLCEKQEFHFSADVFQFGILAKRTFQVKEHFVLRY
jgi:hypothetical protein